MDVEQNRTNDYIDSLLNFAIIGFAKTSTTHHLRLLSEHPEVNTIPHEDFHVRNGEVAEFVDLLYRMESKRGNQQHVKVGYKDPHGIENADGIVKLGKYWPSCRIVVGIRHPVDWFESFYNFHVRFNGPNGLPAPEYLRGACISGSRGVCVEGARFHDYLALLGKTELSDPNELNLLSPSRVAEARAMLPLPNKVFLYEISQIRDDNWTRKEEYMRDLSAFLGLGVNLKDDDTEHESRNREGFFDICDDHYSSLRAALMEAARQASLWIRHFLLPSKDVVVSSPDYFNQVVAGWMKDPCPRFKVHL
ncbi:hypothetical protein ACA910_022152 [Epithemia clementina (nom. ined.)]